MRQNKLQSFCTISAQNSGFKYWKTNDGHKCLMERRETVAAYSSQPQNYKKWVPCILFRLKQGLTKITKSAFDRSHWKREAWEFLQWKETGLLCATKDQQKRVLFLTARGSFIHVHKSKTPIIIQKWIMNFVFYYFAMQNHSFVWFHLQFPRSRFGTEFLGYSMTQVIYSDDMTI